MTTTATPPVPTAATTPVLALRGVGKRFGAVQALSEVDFHVDAGEVVALVGDNGAGKSTLVKVIAGVHGADSGVIEWQGEAVTVTKPTDAQRLGIATVFQDLALCDNLDVVANLFLGDEATRRGVLDEVEMERRSWELLRQLSARIPSVRIPVASLSGGQRQTVAIARSLLGEPKVVMLDEPTAALGVAQTAQVLDLVERLRDRGLGVILITHNLADVRQVADRITILRLGRNAGEFRTADVTQQEIVAAITGASDNVVTRREAKVAGRSGPVVPDSPAALADPDIAPPRPGIRSDPAVGDPAVGTFGGTDQDSVVGRGDRSATGDQPPAGHQVAGDQVAGDQGDVR